MNILEQEDIIKGLPDQALMQEAQMPSGQVPQFLVVSEIQRRSDMRKRFQEDQPQEGTVKDRIVGEAGMGIMGAMPQMPPQMAMTPQMPQSMPQMPPPRMMSGGGQVTLRDRYYNLDTDDTRGEGFEVGADDDPIANRQGILQGLSLLGVDQETIDNATRRTAEPPKGLVDLIENLIRAGKTRGFIDEDFAPGIKVEKKAEGGAVYKPLSSKTQDQLDYLIDSGQIGYADILSLIEQLPNRSSEDRASMVEYVKGRTGTLDRVGYEVGQAVDRFGDRLGSAFDTAIGDRLGSTFNRLTGRTDAETAQDQQFMENLQAGNLKRLPSQEEMLQGAPEMERVGITQGALPMFGGLGGIGRNLITGAGREVTKRGGLPALRRGFMADDFLEFIPMGVSPTQLAGSAATTQLGSPVEGVSYNPDFSGVDESRTLLPPDLRAIQAKTELDQRESLGIDPKPPMADSILADSVPKGGIEEKGGGDEVQATSADRMAELLDRMGRTNRGAALVALGTGIAEGKTMEGGREAANILAKGQQAQTKLEIDATQFDEQMDLLEQRVQNAARSGNASVIAALVTATTRELEALDTAVGREDEATMRRIQSLRNTLSELRRMYMPTSDEAGGVYSFGSLATGSPSRTGS
tara:strand:+ start:6884 stop:8791 length:1908 start_codon:yes stop_codon:yes gene_type:complete